MGRNLRLENSTSDIYTIGNVTGDGVVSFEEAIALTGQGRFHAYLLLVCGGCITSTICELLGVGYLLPAAQCDLNLTDSDKGLLGAIAFIGMLFGSHLWGLLADTTGRKKVIQVTLVVDVIIAVLTALVPGFWPIVALRFLAGFFITAPQAVAYAYLAEFHTPQSRGKAFVWAAVFPALGLVFLPGVGWAVLPMSWTVALPWLTAHSWRLYVVLCALPSLLTAVGITLLPESPKYLLSQGESQRALRVLKRMYATNSGRPDDEFPVQSLQLAASDAATAVRIEQSTSIDSKSVSAILGALWHQTAPLFSFEHILSTLLALFIMFGIIAGANGLPTWLPELFNKLAMHEAAHPGSSASICDSVKDLLVNKTVSANNDDLQVCVVVIEEAVFVNNLYVGLAGIIAPILSVFLVVPMGKRLLLITSLLLTGVCGLGLEFVESSVGFLALSCIVCAVTEMCISLFSSIAVDMFPTHLRAMAVSLSLMFGRLGSIVGNLMFGALLKDACPITFYSLGGILIACGLFSFALPRRGKFQD